MTRLALLGLGLIGGSIARALAGRPAADGWSVAAWSPSGRGPANAAVSGVIETAAADVATALRGADLVVLAAPPLGCLELLDRLAGPDGAGLAPGAVVTDVASTKATIAGRAVALGLPFVGGHPMAGSERAGFAAGSAELFVGRPWVIDAEPGDDRPAIALVERLARDCGAVPVRMPAAAHDRAVAMISHLPLLLAAALVETAAAGDDWADAARLAAGGWRDMTRLARGDVEMSAGVAATNAAAIAGRARAVRDVLDAWIADLEAAPAPDADVLRARFTRVRALLADR